MSSKSPKSISGLIFITYALDKLSLYKSVLLNIIVGLLIIILSLALYVAWILFALMPSEKLAIFKSTIISSPGLILPSSSES